MFPLAFRRLRFLLIHTMRTDIVLEPWGLEARKYGKDRHKRHCSFGRGTFSAPDVSAVLPLAAVRVMHAYFLIRDSSCDGAAFRLAMWSSFSCLMLARTSGFFAATLNRSDGSTSRL